MKTAFNLWHASLLNFAMITCALAAPADGESGSSGFIWGGALVVMLLVAGFAFRWFRRSKGVVSSAILSFGSVFVLSIVLIVAVVGTQKSPDTRANDTGSQPAAPKSQMTSQPAAPAATTQGAGSSPKAETQRNWTPGSSVEVKAISVEEYKLLCSKSQGATSQAITVLSDEPQDNAVLLRGGNIDSVRVLWGKSRAGEEDCYLVVNASGVVRGTSAKASVQGRVKTFFIGEKGEVLVHFATLNF